jgi:hypothetical protein
VLFGVSFALWRYPVWRRRVLLVAAVCALIAAAAVLCERWLSLRRFGRGGSRDVALVIDGSSSMTMEIAGESNFKRAITEASQYINDAPRSVAFSLIIGGSVPNVLTSAPVNDRKHLLRLLDDAVPVQGTMRVLDTLAVAATTLSQGYNGAKQIVLVGDGQSVGWNTGEPELWECLKQAFAILPAKPQVVWRKLPLPESIRNLTLSDIRFSRQVVGTDRDVRIDVTVDNTGRESVTPSDIRLTADGRVLVDRSVGQLEPGASATVSFLHRFTTPGAQVVTAAVTAGDEMAADDTAARVVQVMSRLRVLVADGGGAMHFLERPGGFLTLSLRPDLTELARPAPPAGSAVAPASRDFLVEPELVAAGALGLRDNFDPYAVVVLADVPRLPDELATRLAEFVARGGGLLIVDGSHVEPAFYNAWRANGETVLPLPLGALVVGGPTNRVAVDPRTFTHAALKPLAAASDLDGAFVERYRQTEEGDDAARVGGRLSNGAALLAERKLGRGLVMQVTAALDPSSGNIVARQSFVPFVHELVYHLAQPVAANLNILPARGATLSLSGGGDANEIQGASGLRAEYFKSHELRRPVLVRQDPNINFRWGSASPGTRVPKDRFAARWTGSLIPPRSGSYTFTCSGDDRLRVWIAGQRMVAVLGRDGTLKLDLKAQVRCDVRAELQQDEGDASAILEWEGPAITRQPVPTTAFSPVRGRLEAWSDGIETLVKAPDRQTLPAQILNGNDGLALRIDRNLVPGLYSVQVPTAVGSLLGHLAGSDGTFPFCVIADGNESRLAPLTVEEIAFVRRYVDLLVANLPEDVVRALRGNAFGRELWQILALAALVLLLVEIALTRWIAIQRRTGEEGTVCFEESGQPSSTFREQVAKLRRNG